MLKKCFLKNMHYCVMHKLYFRLFSFIDMNIFFDKRASLSELSAIYPNIDLIPFSEKFMPYKSLKSSNTGGIQYTLGGAFIKFLLMRLPPITAKINETYQNFFIILVTNFFSKDNRLYRKRLL